MEYSSPRLFVKPPRAARRRNSLAGKPHPKGAGTQSSQGEPWVAQVRQFRAQAKALHAQCNPAVRADYEATGLDLLEFIYELDPRSLHILSMAFATLWRLSNR
jgi:hypothetical protein